VISPVVDPSMRLIKAIQSLLHPQPRRALRRRGKVATRKASDPFLLTVWRQLRAEFFPDRADLDDYSIYWSSRPQKRVLASCNIRRRRVVVARELFESAACQWISPVVFHEMCHAVLGESVTSASGRRSWHGREFRALEALHPDIPALNMWITSGGWSMAVRSYRAKMAWKKRSRQAPHLIQLTSHSE
jgi:hypothetical protein